MRALFMISLLAIAVPDRPDLTPKQDKPTVIVGIQGHWKPVKVIVFGHEEKPSAEHENTIGVFTASEFHTLGGDGKEKGQKITYVLDKTKTPATIDLSINEGWSEMKVGGIFKLEGDMLTICIAVNNANRPTTFESTPGSQILLMQLQRIPK